MNILKNLYSSIFNKKNTEMNCNSVDGISTKKDDNDETYFMEDIEDIQYVCTDMNRSFSGVSTKENTKKTDLKKNNFLENILFPLKSFTTKDTYTLSIDLDRNKRKFIVLHCNCGLKFGRSYRTSCKHIDKISSMTFNKMIKTYEKSLIKKSIHEMIDKVPLINNINNNNNHDINEHKLYILVKSSTTNEEYKVFVDETFKLTCTCGIQFGLNLRTKCKHIDQISKLSLAEIQGLLINNPDKIDELFNTLVI